MKIKLNNLKIRIAELKSKKISNYKSIKCAKIKMPN